MSLWKSLKPVSVVPVFWKEFELFVKIKSVLELCVFVKQCLILLNLTNERDYKTPLACHAHDLVDLCQYWNLSSQYNYHTLQCCEFIEETF